MKINLANVAFTDRPTLLAADGEFTAVAFRYSTGVAALKVSNRRGSFTILPWMGQMIWRCDFDGRELAMKSIYDEPKDCKDCFNESYGCFMMHCGLTAMGNPTAEDDHVGHAELPIIRYSEAYLEFGKDRLGEYVAVGGTARHDMCFTYNYSFSPRVVLRKGAAKIEIAATVKNLGAEREVLWDMERIAELGGVRSSSYARAVEHYPEYSFAHLIYLPSLCRL